MDLDFEIWNQEKIAFIQIKRGMLNIFKHLLVEQMHIFMMMNSK